MRFAFAILATLVVVLSGCGKDPQVADLEALDSLGKTLFQNTKIRELNRKIAVAKSNEEKAAALEELIQMVEGQAKEISAFQAKTPEVGKIANSFNTGISLLLSGAKRAKSAYLKESQAELSAATAELTEGQKAISNSGQEFAKLAKEKGVAIGKQRQAE
jgi:hypothetical protein